MPTRHKSNHIPFSSNLLFSATLWVENTLVCSFQPFILCLSIPCYPALHIFLECQELLRGCDVIMTKGRCQCWGAIHSVITLFQQSLLHLSKIISIALGILSSQVHNGGNALHQSLLCLSDPFSTVQPPGIFYIPSAALGYRICPVDLQLWLWLPLFLVSGKCWRALQPTYLSSLYILSFYPSP